MQECKYACFLSPQNFNPNLTWSKLFQTERTRRLAHLLSFCELVSFMPRCFFAQIFWGPIFLPNFFWPKEVQSYLRLRPRRMCALFASYQSADQIESPNTASADCLVCAYLSLCKYLHIFIVHGDFFFTGMPLKI